MAAEILSHPGPVEEVSIGALARCENFCVNDIHRGVVSLIL